MILSGTPYGHNIIPVFKKTHPCAYWIIRTASETVITGHTRPWIDYSLHYIFYILFQHAKVQQIFGIHKDFMQNVKFIWRFCGKALLLAQKCESNFGGNPLGACRRYNKYLLFFWHMQKKCTNNPYLLHLYGLYDLLTRFNLLLTPYISKHAFIAISNEYTKKCTKVKKNLHICNFCCTFSVD